MEAKGSKHLQEYPDFKLDLVDLILICSNPLQPDSFHCQLPISWGSIYLRNGKVEGIPKSFSCPFWNCGIVRTSLPCNVCGSAGMQLESEIMCNCCHSPPANYIATEAGNDHQVLWMLTASQQNGRNIGQDRFSVIFLRWSENQCYIGENSTGVPLTQIHIC